MFDCLGRIGFYEYFTCILFDSDALYSFFLATFVHLSKLVMEPLLKSLSVVLLIGKVVVCSMVAIGCPLVLCTHVLEANLLVFKLLEFVIIMGIN